MKQVMSVVLVLTLAQPAEAGILHRLVRIVTTPVRCVVAVLQEQEEGVAMGYTYGWK